jgi:TolB-like protein
MRLFYFMLFYMSFSAILFAQSAIPNIAVLDLDGNGITKSDLGGLSNRLRAELINTGKFNVIERSKMDEILKEQGFQQTGCTNTECAVEIGQLIGVQQIVIGSVDKVADILSVNIRLVDVRSGKIGRNAIQDCEACGLSDVLKVTIHNTARLLAGLESDKFTDKKPTSFQPLSQYHPITETPTNLKSPDESSQMRLKTTASIDRPKGVFVLSPGWTSTYFTKIGIQHGLKLFFGTRKNNHSFGIEGKLGLFPSPLIASKASSDTLFRAIERQIGAGFIYSYEGIRPLKYLTICLGLAAGVWRTGRTCERENGGITSGAFYELVGPRFRTQFGNKKIFFCGEYTPFFGTESENTGMVHEIDISVRFEF